jgi:hypothetical protein
VEEAVYEERNSMLDQLILREALDTSQIVWRKHALEQMLVRGITRSEVIRTVRKCEQIEVYPDDFPFPSALFFGKVGVKVLHVVAALDTRGHGEIHVISAYEPDRDHFQSDLKTRRRKS